MIKLNPRQGRGLILDPGILGNDESLKKLNGHKIILHTHLVDSSNTTLYHCRIAELSMMSQNCSFVETLWASYDSYFTNSMVISELEHQRHFILA